MVFISCLLPVTWPVTGVWLFMIFRADFVFLSKGTHKQGCGMWDVGVGALELKYSRHMAGDLEMHKIISYYLLVIS